MSLKLVGRLCVTLLGALALTAGVYHGDKVTINFPDGWSAPETDADGIISSKQGENGANCNIDARNLATIADMTMAEINAEFGHVFQVPDWADFLTLAPEDITLIASDVRPLGDAIFHIATMKIALEDADDAMVRYGFYVLPGRVVMAGCYVEESLYPIYTSLFEATVSSLRPW